MTMTPNQRKYYWLAAIVLVVVYYFPSIAMMAMRAANPPQPAPQPRPSPFARQGRPPAVPPGPARGSAASVQQAATSPTSTPVAADPPAVVALVFRDLLGQYSGKTNVNSRGICGLTFELRDSREKPGEFSGYSTLTCTSLSFLQQKRLTPSMVPALLSVKPISAILAGVADGGAIHFHVDDTVTAEGCAPTAFTIKPFGTNKIAAEWQDACHGGAMLLARSGR